MRTKRNTCNGAYYPISNPTPMNEKTGNFCVSPNYVMNNDKDYIFDWIDINTGNKIEKIISRDYVKNHITYLKISKWDAEHISKEYKGYCFIITLKDILNY